MLKHLRSDLDKKVSGFVRAGSMNSGGKIRAEWGFSSPNSNKVKNADIFPSLSGEKGNFS